MMTYNIFYVSNWGAEETQDPKNWNNFQNSYFLEQSRVLLPKTAAQRSTVKMLFWKFVEILQEKTYCKVLLQPRYRLKSGNFNKIELHHSYFPMNLQRNTRHLQNVSFLQSFFFDQGFLSRTLQTLTQVKAGDDLYFSPNIQTFTCNFLSEITASYF